MIRARKGVALPMNDWLSRIFKTRKVDGLFTLDDESFAYDNVKAQVKIGRSTRTINAAAPGRIRSYFDVTDAVTMGRDGHPQYNSIQEQADKLVIQLRAVLYGSGTS